MDALCKIQQAGFTLTVSGDNLGVTPATKLTDEQRAFIRSHKPEILQALKAANDTFDPLVVNCWTPNGDTISIRAQSADHAAWLGTVNPKPEQIPEVSTPAREPEPLDGLAPYRVNVDGTARVIWLDPGLSPSRVVVAATAKLRAAVSLEPPPGGWPRLNDLPALDDPNPATRPADPCPACHHGHFWLDHDIWRCSYCDPWPDEFTGETLTLPGGRAW